MSIKPLSVCIFVPATKHRGVTFFACFFTVWVVFLTTLGLVVTLTVFLLLTVAFGFVATFFAVFAFLTALTAFLVYLLAL